MRAQAETPSRDVILSSSGTLVSQTAQCATLPYSARCRDDSAGRERSRGFQPAPDRAERGLTKIPCSGIRERLESISAEGDAQTIGVTEKQADAATEES